MCGICGIAHSDPSYMIPEQQITAMRDSLAHRGPDDAGNYLAGGIALGSRRLAILDLSERGHMPMSTPDGRYWITYNGEIYNYRELRPALEVVGVQFRSNTDTEVLLHLYIHFGADMLHQLNGMFAFAIWDNVDRALFIARDRLGIKPLSYTIKNNALYFASEEKALFRAGVPAEFDPQCWDELMYFRYVAGESTPFADVKRLLPGHCLFWSEGKITLKRWWNLSEQALHQREASSLSISEWYHTTFDSAVNYRRISDVPVGVMLSGGLDSSLVAASLATQAGENVASFTVRFEEPYYDEGQYALDVAKKYNLNFYSLTIPPEEKLYELLCEASWLYDAPLAHGNDAQMLALSHYAKPRVTVLMSGEGADETLGGYVRYKPLMYPWLFQLAKPFSPLFTQLTNANGRLKKFARFASNGNLEDFVLFNSCDVLPIDTLSLANEADTRFEYRRTMLREAQTLYPGDYLRQAMYSDQHLFLCSLLDRNDRMTMGASIECRVPFLDYRLVETLAALPTSQFIERNSGKALARNAMGDRLPQSVLRHRKWGFGVPWTKYLRLTPVFRDIVEKIPSHDVMQQSRFKPRAVQEVVRGFLDGDDAQSLIVRQWVMMSLWYDVYFDKVNEMTYVQ